MTANEHAESVTIKVICKLVEDVHLLKEEVKKNKKEAMVMLGRQQKEESCRPHSKENARQSASRFCKKGSSLCS